MLVKVEAGEGEAALRNWYLASRNLDSPIQERHLGKVSGEVTAVVRKYQYLINAESLLFWRAINALDSTALRLNPQFDLLGELRDFFQRQGFSGGTKGGEYL